MDQPAALDLQAPGTTGTALATIEKMTALQVFAPGAVDPLLDAIAAEVRLSSHDISTERGRKAIASLAYKVAHTKTFLDNMGKTLVADWKVKANAVDAERRKIRERLDALRDEARKPLDEYEAAEATRIAAHEAVIADIERRGVLSGPEYRSTDIQAQIDHFREPDTRDWQEFAKRAADVRARAITNLETTLARLLKAEAEAAELVRLREEAAERERQDAARRQREREAAIAAKAADDARIAAELKARQEREAAAAKAEADRLAAEQAAAAALQEAEAERQRVEQEAAAERARLEAERLAAEERAAQAERARIAAAEKAEADRIAAERKAEADKAAAVEAERARAAAAAKAEADAAAKREADKKHRATINREALAAFVAAGLSEAAGKTAVEAIARGAVPHVRITY